MGTTIIVTIVGSKDSFMSTVVNQCDLTIENANSFATTMFTALEISKFPSSRKLPTTKALTNNDQMTKYSFSTATSRSMDKKVIDTMGNKNVNSSGLSLYYFDAAYDSKNEIELFSSTTSHSETKNEGT